MEQPTEAPAVEQDTPPVEAAPAETPAAEETFAKNFDPAALTDDLRPAYRQMHGDYTRKMQEVAAQRKEAEQAISLLNSLGDETSRPDAIAQIAEQAGGIEVLLDALGFTVDDDSPEDEGFAVADDEDDTDHPDFRDPRLDPLLEQIEAAKAEAERAAELAKYEQHFTEQFAKFSEIEGRDLTGEEQNLITAAALAAPPGDDGMPNTLAAYELLTNVWEQRQKSWVASKQAPQASEGQAGTEQVNWRDPEERRRRMAAIMDAEAE